MTNLERIKDLHLNYVNTGKMLEGFDKYYADDVVMQELGEEPMAGKATNRKREVEFLSGIKEMHGGSILSFAEDTASNKTMVESWMELTFSNGYRVKCNR